jgi:hypothetical protein
VFWHVLSASLEDTDELFWYGYFFLFISLLYSYSTTGAGVKVSFELFTRFIQFRIPGKCSSLTSCSSRFSILIGGMKNNLECVFIFAQALY